MNPSRLFIRRPIATLLLMASLLVTGLFAYHQLSISALPQVDYPTIQVTTRYPGASAQVMLANVTAPLERQLGEMSGLTQMYSNSAGGASVITLTFDLNTTLDIAEQEVQEAINSASNLVPSDLPDPPTYKKVNPADPAVLTLAVSSNERPLTEVQDLVNTRVMLKISQLSGVGLVSLEGGHKPAIRIRADPGALAAHQLSLEDLNTAVNKGNQNGSKGGFDGPDHSVSIDANDQLETAEEYAELILKYENGKAIRMGDVATLEEAPEDVYQSAWANGKPAIVISVKRQPNANVIEVVDRVKALLPKLEAALPASVDIQLLSDRTETIRASIRDVQYEMLLAVALVVLVCFLFLHRAAATLIPGVAVPLSLVGTFGVMYLAGFSLNNLSLMALTVATGFVIDDAIVVLENIQRHMEEGQAPMAAALEGSRQIAFTIISLTLSLIAVLIPLLFMGDVVGRLFREFAITLAAAILVSMLVSLSLTPMLSAYFLRPVPQARQGRLTAWADRQFQRLINTYDRALQWVLERQTLTLLFALACIGLTAWLYLLAPKGFFPSQDTGLIQATSIAPQGISFAEMGRRQQELARSVAADPDVASVSSVIGADGGNDAQNQGRLQITLKPFAARSARVDEVIRRLRAKAARVSGITLYLTPGQDLTVDTLGMPSQYQLTLDASQRGNLEEWVPKLTQALAQRPEFRGVVNNLQNRSPQSYIRIDRALAARYGLSATDIDTALYNAYGQRLISTIFTQSNQYRVVLEAAPQYRLTPEAIDRLYLAAADTSATEAAQGTSSGTTGSASNSGQSGNRTGTPMVRLTSVASVEQRLGYENLSRLDQLPAAALSFDLAKGVSLEQARRVIGEVSQGIGLPDSLTLRYQGASDAFSKANRNTPWLILAALLTMYLVLGVLYESFIHPLTILSTLPSAAIGAFLALRLAGLDFSLIALIGIILLIGIVKKNAIMLIDFALEGEREEHLSPLEAIHRACLLRFRPILMTTMAAMLGALPLMLASGAGAELRRPLGVSIVGGLLLSQLLTLFTTPVIYLFFDRLARRLPPLWTPDGPPT